MIRFLRKAEIRSVYLPMCFLNMRTKCSNLCFHD
jgi:hypothetical protein